MSEPRNGWRACVVCALTFTPRKRGIRRIVCSVGCADALRERQRLGIDQVVSHALSGQPLTR